MECEICGKKVEKVFVAEIEGVVLKVCEECSKSGKILNVIDDKKKNKPVTKTQKLNYEEDYELIENYGMLIREARNQAGLSIEELARIVGEKSSYIRKIEKEEIRPSEKIISKLEKILRIKLTEKLEEKIEKQEKEDKMRLRIADVVEIKD